MSIEFARRVIVESPYRGDVDLNLEYARACVRDSLERGEAPFASHLLYTQPGILDDNAPEQRTWGIEAGFAWRAAAHLTAVYMDRGISQGMRMAIESARRMDHPVEYRRLVSWRIG